jgi:hypothetical protein
VPKAGPPAANVAHPRTEARPAQAPSRILARRGRHHPGRLRQRESVRRPFLRPTGASVAGADWCRETDGPLAFTVARRAAGLLERSVTERSSEVLDRDGLVRVVGVAVAELTVRVVAPTEHRIRGRRCARVEPARVHQDAGRDSQHLHRHGA